MTVATALAVSWNPFTNSKLRARPRANRRKIPLPTDTTCPKSSIRPPRPAGGSLGHPCLRRVTWSHRPARGPGATTARGPTGAAHLVRGEIALTNAEIADMNTAHERRNTRKSDDTAPTRQGSLRIVVHAIRLHVPHTANRKETRRIRATAATVAMRASARLNRGVKVKGIGNRARRTGPLYSDRSGRRLRRSAPRWDRLASAAATSP